MDANHSVVRKGNVPLTSVTPPDMHKEHAFGCAGTPKMPNELREHKIASPSAFDGPQDRSLNLEALKIKTRSMRAFMSITVHQQS